MLVTSCRRLLTLPRTRDAKAAARGDELSGLSPERAEGSRSSSLPGLPHLKVNAYPAAAFPCGLLPRPSCRKHLTLSPAALFIPGPLLFPALAFSPERLTCEEFQLEAFINIFPGDHTGSHWQNSVFLTSLTSTISVWSVTFLHQNIHRKRRLFTKTFYQQ